ncbi:MAG TPA: phosphopantothenoylcysteine decarboxylase [Verrucomicrobiae bacterium]|jgi:phosphopantothenoylcysteine decarboxylase/phosphopantothenate--cysteine ligase|nr:phosphopantothenoylcysteine decarboxylase [Verrucomicrobiae bacterium]
MNCIVTAGPTYENLDKVRRLTNFSTGRLGVELANFLVARGHDVTLLIGKQSTHPGERRAQRIETFSTTTDLRDWLQAQAGSSVNAVFHAAAVCDFTFGKIWSRSAQGDLTEVKEGKISTRQGTLLAELVPTPKIITDLRDWFPKAKLVGWKYETDGDRASVISAAEKQIRECLTDACVANGPAYGIGFGIITPDSKCAHVREPSALYDALEKLI